MLWKPREASVTVIVHVTLFTCHDCARSLLGLENVSDVPSQGTTLKSAHARFHVSENAQCDGTQAEFVFFCPERTHHSRSTCGTCIGT